MPENDNSFLFSPVVSNANEVEGVEGSAVLPAVPYSVNSGDDPPSSEFTERVFDNYISYIPYERSTEKFLFNLNFFDTIYEGRLNATPLIKSHLETNLLPQVFENYISLLGPRATDIQTPILPPSTAETQQVLASPEAEIQRTQIISNFEPVLEKFIEESLESLSVSEASIDELQYFISFKNPSFNAYDKVEILYKAMFGGFWPGTDEQAIFDALTGLSAIEITTLKKTYTFYCEHVKNDGPRDLISDLDSEMDGTDQERYEALINSNESQYIATSLREAVDDSFLGIDWGTDEDSIMSLLRNKSPQEITSISQEYEKLYGESLLVRLENELDEDSHDLARMRALMNSNTNEADAHALDQAMHSTFLGIDWGTDEDQIESVYTDIRNDVESDPASSNLSYDELNEQVSLRNTQVETEYNNEYTVEGSNSSSLRNAFTNETDGVLEVGQGSFFNALADNDLDAIDASKLAMEFDDFITSDEAVNDILENQYTRAVDEVTRNHQSELNQALEGVTNRFERERITREFDHRMALLAETVCRQNMNDLESAYEDIPNAVNFDMGIRLFTYGAGRENALDLIDNGGVLSPAQRIYHAINGAGTDLQDIKAALNGKTLAEINEIDTEFQQISGRTLRQALLEDHIIGVTELSGRDAMDIELLLDYGVATTRQEELEIAIEKYNNELAMAGVNGVSTEDMEFHLVRMQIFNDKLDNAEAGGSQDLLMNETLLGLESQTFDNAIERYRSEVDAITNAITTIAAIVIGVIIAIATAGSGSGLSVAIISSAVASAANIGLKQVMLGGAYGNEAVATDLALAVLDAATAGLTRNMGDDLIKNSQFLTRLNGDPSFKSRLLASTIADAYSSIPGNFSQTIAGEVLNEQNWVDANATDDLLFRMTETIAINGATGIAQSVLTNVAIEGIGLRSGTETSEENLADSDIDTKESQIGDDTINNDQQDGQENSVNQDVNDLVSLIDGSSEPQSSTSKNWNDPDVSVSEFLTQIQTDNPNTSLTQDQLINKYNQGLRFNPETRKWNRVIPRNQLKDFFMNNLAVRDDVTLTTEQKNQMWDHYQSGDYDALYAYSNHLLEWPVAKGGAGHQFEKPIEANQVFDRYGSVMKKGDETILTGSFFANMEDGVAQSFESRALNQSREDYDIYYRVEVLKDLDFTATESTAIPWFGLEGGSVQSEWNIPIDPNTNYPISLTQLEKDGFIKITILESPNGKHTDLINE